VVPRCRGILVLSCYTRTFTTGTIARQAWYFRVGATNAAGTSWSTPIQVAAAP
jgi:hypothetical protein